MSKIVKFKQEEETCSCPTCDLIFEFIEYVKDAESEDQLFDILSGLVNEAKKIGFRDAIIQDIDIKMTILDKIDGECDCDECCSDDECDC